MGIGPSSDGRLSVSPNLPPDWCCAGIRNMPCNGKQVSLFVYEGKLYTNVEVHSVYPQEVFDRDVTCRINCNAYAIALNRGKDTLIFVSKRREAERES